MKIEKFGNHVYLADCLTGMPNFRITIDSVRKEINVPATGPISSLASEALIYAIRYAMDCAINPKLLEEK